MKWGALASVVQYHLRPAGGPVRADSQRRSQVTLRA